MSDPKLLNELQKENTYLISLLQLHGIDWKQSPEPTVISSTQLQHAKYSIEDRISIFRRLFRGRTDVYPMLSDYRCFLGG